MPFPPRTHGSARPSTKVRNIDQGQPPATFCDATSTAGRKPTSATDVLAHHNHNYGRGIFNNVRGDQNVQGRQLVQGDQHFGGHQYMLNFTFPSKGTASDKGGHKSNGLRRVWEREPYQAIISTLAHIRHHVLWYGKHLDLEKTAAGICDELDELEPLVRWMARSINQFEAVFPKMFAFHPFFHFVETRAFEWNTCLKELKEDIAELNPHQDPPRAAEMTASGWSALSQRLRECICGPRAEMACFLRIFVASAFFRRLDIRDEGVEAFITKLAFAWDLHSPKVDTIWLREPTGSRWLSIPLRFCETWNDFSHVVYEYCGNGPEKDYIREGNWAIIRDTDNIIIDQTQFTGVLKPEMRFDIGVIIQLLSAMADTCPQCGHRSNKSTSVDGWIRCSNVDCGSLFHVAFHPNKSIKPTGARKGRQTRASSVTSTSARASATNSKPSTPEFQCLSTKFHRILATVPRSLGEPEARKGRAQDDAGRKAKGDAGGKLGTKTAANLAIRSLGPGKANHIESCSGLEPITDPSLSGEPTTLSRKLPMALTNVYTCTGGVNILVLLRATRRGLMERAEVLGANVLVDESWKCTICKIRWNGGYKVNIRYHASATRSSVPDPYKPVALENAKGVPGLMTIIKRNG
ncbi:hypothetical protein AB1N83_011284 [Pleurotus pulmonarius]|nr:hypothetical protein EYR36_010653 [Pleurotus pulmonarius]KAF4590559.1 hypothetical protein EYR38_009861 [Pleurotus pulmonarius]